MMRFFNILVNKSGTLTTEEGLTKLCEGLRKGGAEPIDIKEEDIFNTVTKEKEFTVLVVKCLELWPNVKDVFGQNLGEEIEYEGLPTYIS